MLDDMTKFTFDENAINPDWYEIDADQIDTNFLLPLKAKQNIKGKYQAGVKISACRWRWSVKVYDTAQEAEAEAVNKAKELWRIKNEK